MRLIADSGGTKTEWAIAGAGRLSPTSGLNPVVMGLEKVEACLRQELLPQINPSEISVVEFYGAGCTPEICPEMERLFRSLFPEASSVAVASDLLGAAKALCGDREGIAAILGTGSNSCLYNGKKIIRNTPALGFILGDEGSGAVLGRLFLNALLKGRLPESIAKDFLHETKLTLPIMINKVYREPQANRFLASLSPFIHRHRNDGVVRGIIVGNFRTFFICNIRPYQRPDLPVNCVGSIALSYEDELREAARAEGFNVGRLLRTPLETLP